MLIEIDVRYLDKKDLARFLQIKNAVETSYREALSGLTVDIPYTPRLYIIPFLRRLVSEGKYKFAWNSLGPDPWLPKKLAIFPSLPFLERAHPRHIVDTLAHELAHLLYTIQTPILPIKKTNSLRKIDLVMEERLRSVFRCFKEPLRSRLRTWEAMSRDPEFTNPIISDAPFRTFTSHGQFFRYLKSKPKAKMI